MQTSLIKNITIVFNAIVFSFKDCSEIEHLKRVITGEIKFRKVWDCLYGTYIDYLYYKGKHLLSEMTILQLEFRHYVMNPICKENGACIKCGCTTTALQASKPKCLGNCYPDWMYNFEFKLRFLVIKDGKLQLDYNNINRYIKTYENVRYSNN